MPKTFTVTTTATDALKTDAKGHAEATFTVTNTNMSRPMRGLLSVAPLDSTKAEWLKITGETAREFQSGGTQQVVVTFDAPVTATTAGPTPASDAAADKYSFRLDVAAATNPDDDTTEGPVVKVERTAVAPSPVKKPFPKWIFIPIAAVVLIGLGILAWLLLRDKGPKTLVVPDVANATESDARQRLETECQAQIGCLVVTVNSVADNTVAKGNALGTDPVAGTEVPVGSNVVLVVSSGPEATPVVLYKLPPVANLIEERAKRALETGCGKPEACVQVDVSRVADAKVPAGTAIRTDPETGAEVNQGDKVTMFVSKGPDKVTIVDVAKQTAEAALDRLEKSCEPVPCLQVEVNRIADNQVPRGQVIRTQPGPGTVVNAGSKVLLFVSGGTDEVTIPSVFGLLTAQARDKLTNACRPAPCLQITQANQNSALVPAGKAISTAPRSGSAVKIGSTIVLNVSLGPELTVVGTYKALAEATARARIAGDGFVVGTVKKVPNPFIGSLVTAQDPPPGARRARGTRINLTVVGR